MSCSEIANLAYGFFLGTDEEWAVEEADEYGSLDRPWANDDPIDGIYRALLQASILASTEIEKEAFSGMERTVQERWNLKVDLFANFERQGAAYFLMAGKKQTASSLTAEPVTLTLPKDADTVLLWAVRVLEISPIQKTPQWMLYPTYI